MSQRDLYDAFEHSLKGSPSYEPKCLVFIGSNVDANFYSATGTANAPGLVRRLLLEYFRAEFHAPLTILGNEFHSATAVVSMMEHLLRQDPNRPIIIRPAFDAATSESRSTLALDVTFIADKAVADSFDEKKFGSITCCIATVSERDPQSTDLVLFAQKIARSWNASREPSLPFMNHSVSIAPAAEIFSTDATTIDSDDAYEFNESSSLMRSYLLA